MFPKKVIYSFVTGTPDSPNGIDYELYVTKKVWSKTVGGEDVIADRIFHYHQVCSNSLLVTKNIEARLKRSLSGHIRRSNGKSLHFLFRSQKCENSRITTKSLNYVA